MLGDVNLSIHTYSVRGPAGRGRLTIPPSRAKANIIRLLLVMLKRPQCHTQTDPPLARPSLQEGHPRRTHDQGEERQSAVFAEYVNQDLENRLPVLARYCTVEVLDREEESHEDEEAEQGAEADARYDADGSAPRRLLRLLAQVGRCVESCPAGQHNAVGLYPSPSVWGFAPVSVYCESNAPHIATYAGLARMDHPSASRPVPSLKRPNTNEAG